MAIIKLRPFIYKLLYFLKMSTSIWNLTHPLRSGHIELKKGGSELFGTVIRHGKMKKTATVIIIYSPNSFCLGISIKICI